MSRSWRLERRSGSWKGARSPRRYGSHTGTFCGSPLRSGCGNRAVTAETREHSPRPVDEQRAGVARATHEDPVGNGVGNRPQARYLDPFVDHDPDDERCPQKNEDVADLGSSGDDLVAQSIDGPTGEMGAGTGDGAGRLAHGYDGRPSGRHRPLPPKGRPRPICPTSAEHREKRSSPCRSPGHRRWRTSRRPVRASSRPRAVPARPPNVGILRHPALRWTERLSSSPLSPPSRPRTSP